MLLSSAPMCSVWTWAISWLAGCSYSLEASLGSSFLRSFRASPTWRIRGGVSAEVVDYQRNRLQGLHYRAGETEGFGDVILGGGWGGNTSFRRSKSIWTSDSGWV